MHRSLARYSAPVSFVQAPSWADFTTTMVGFEVFGTHRGDRQRYPTSPAGPTGRQSSFRRNEKGQTICSTRVETTDSKSRISTAVCRALMQILLNDLPPTFG